MWERTLQDLIRGLRAHKSSSKAELDAFIDEALEEIRVELKGKDMELKAEAVMKMCYLMMLYPIPPPPSFAFYVVEVMSSPRYHLKQLGYIAAPMAFSSETEEVVLTVNGIRKDLLSPQASLPPLALAGLSDIITPSLAREVNQDVITLLSHSRPHVRKRAVLALFKVCEKYPDALRSGFARLRERLEDEDPGVVSATVNVVCELSRKSNPRNYLPLAPQLFEILTTSSNNWMLIKIVKLFATLTPIEPRLVRKLLPPLTNLISTTPAISLLYECVRTCIVGGMLDSQTEAGDALARVCVEKLSAFLSDEDQNLKYIALLAMVKIVPSHPHLVADYQDEILESVDDADVSIRMRALELASAMVNRSNVRDIVSQLLSHLVPPTTTAATLPSAMASLQGKAIDEPSAGITSPPSSAIMSPAYRLEVVRRILQITSADTYSNITDFDWYMSVLIDLTYVSNVDVGEQIKDIILDVVARVRSVRSNAVGLLARLLDDTSFLDNLGEEAYCGEVIYAAAWVCGEYSSELYDAKSTMLSLLQPSIRRLSPATIAVCISAATKVFGNWAAGLSENWDAQSYADAKSLVEKAIETFTLYASSSELEIQERAANSLQLFRFVQADLNTHKPPNQPIDVPDMPNGFQTEDADANPNAQPSYPKSLFLIQPLHTGYEMNPVGYRAQESVKVPEGLDLDSVLLPTTNEHDAEDEYDEGMLTSEDEVDLGEGGGQGLEELRRVLRASEGKEKGKKRKKGKKDGLEETPEERLARKAARRAKRKDDPYYLDSKAEDDVDSIPIVKLELNLPEEPSTTSLQSSRKTSKRSKATEPLPPPPEIDRSGEMPEGATPLPVDSSKQSKGKGKATNGDGDGLQTVDLTAADLVAGPRAPVARSRFEEYTLDEDETRPTSRSEAAEPPAAEAAKVEVVKVKKKKKKQPVPLQG